MSTSLPDKTPEDPENLLRSGLRDTTPEFEKRWTNLKREMRSEPAPRRSFTGSIWFRFGLPVGIAAAATVMLIVGHSPRHDLPPTQLPPAAIAAFDDLLELDATLSDAAPLTNQENLDVLFNLSNANGNQT